MNEPGRSRRHQPLELAYYAEIRPAMLMAADHQDARSLEARSQAAGSVQAVHAHVVAPPQLLDREIADHALETTPVEAVDDMQDADFAERHLITREPQA